MSDKDKEIKTIDINNNNFFNDEDMHFAKIAKAPTSDGFLTKLLIIAVLLSFLLIAFVVTSPFERFKSSDIKQALAGKSTKGQNGFVLFKKRENILFLGVDSNGRDTDPFENTRTDTIMLASIDKATKSVNIVSIPRDSKVYIDGHGVDKINAAHALGGIDLTIKTVQEMFGVNVDHYVLVNYEGLKEIIKVLGTIPVTVEKRLRYKDYAGHLFVNLDPGKQELNADQVEQFARFRHDAVGDIGRMERQRILMKGIVQKLQTPEGLAKLPEVISTAGKYVKTDMTVFDMTRYAGIASSINVDDIAVATLPGRPSENSYISYWVLDPDRVQSVIDRLVYRIEKQAPQEGPLKVSILYNGYTTDEVEAIKTILTENNMEVICDRQSKKSSPEVLAHSDNVTTLQYKELKTLLPQLKTAPMTISYDLFYCGESDMTLVLAKPE